MDNQDTYFAADSQGAVKIGRSYNIKERLMQFQRDRGGEVTLLAMISGGDAELGLHRRFAHLKIDGEWYKPEPEMLEFIRGLNCNPMTLSEYKEADRRMGWDFTIHEHPCFNCGEHISWNHFLYPDFDDRYERFYRHGNFICLNCYRLDTRRSHICKHLIRASVTRPMDWPKIWRLRNELEQLMLEGDCDFEIDATRQPRLL